MMECYAREYPWVPRSEDYGIATLSGEVRRRCTIPEEQRFPVLQSGRDNLHRCAVYVGDGFLRDTGEIKNYGTYLVAQSGGL